MKTEQLLNQTFSSEKKVEAKTIEISVLCCLQVEKFNILLESLLPYTYPIIYPKCVGSGIQTTVKPNKLLSVMTVHDIVSIMVSWRTCYNLVIQIIFLAWLVFVKVIFLYWNLKLDDTFLPYMSEAFNKTVHGFTNIIIAWNDFKPVFHHFGSNSTYIYCELEWSWRTSTMVGACVDCFKEFRVTTLSKNFTSQLV